MPRPYVVVHNEVSLDGRLDHLNPDLGRFYSLARRWHEDATLVGADTILAMEEELGREVAADDSPQEAAEPAESAESADLPFLVVVDSRGRVERWRELRDQPYWGRSLVLCSERTPAEYRAKLADLDIDAVVAGGERVDLRLALEELNRLYGVQTLRVDSGGSLNGALLRADLVDEVSVLFEPRLVGGETPRSLMRAAAVSGPQEIVELRLMAMEAFADDVVWLRYRVLR